MSDRVKISINESPNTMETNHRYYIALSDPKNHTNHSLKDAALTRKAHDLRLQTQGTSVRKGSRKRKRNTRIDSNDPKVIRDQNESDIVSPNQDTGDKEDSHMLTSVDIQHVEAPSTISVPCTFQSSMRPELSVSTTTLPTNTTEAGPSGVVSQVSPLVVIPGLQNFPAVHLTPTTPVASVPATTSASPVATRCAKVLEKLINATLMVENADKLVELERKANELLREASTSVKSSVIVDKVLVRTDDDVGPEPQRNNVLETGTTRSKNVGLSSTEGSDHVSSAEKDSQHGQTRKHAEQDDNSDAHEGPFTKSIEYVTIPGGNPPSIIYTYSPMKHKNCHY